MPSINNGQSSDNPAAELPQADTGAASPDVHIQFDQQTVYQDSSENDRPTSKMNRSKATLLMAVLMLAQQTGIGQVENTVDIDLHGAVNVTLAGEQVFCYAAGEVKINAIAESDRALLEQRCIPESIRQDLKEKGGPAKTPMSAGAIALTELHDHLVEPTRQWLQEQVQAVTEYSRAGWKELTETSALALRQTRKEEAENRQIVLKKTRYAFTTKLVTIGKALVRSHAAIEGMFRGEQFTFCQKDNLLTITRNTDKATVLLSDGETVKTRMCDSELTKVCRAAQVLAEQQTVRSRSASSEER